MKGPPFICTICRKAFTFYSDLTKHWSETNGFYECEIDAHKLLIGVASKHKGQDTHICLVSTICWTSYPEFKGIKNPTFTAPYVSAG